MRNLFALFISAIVFSTITRAHTLAQLEEKIIKLDDMCRPAVVGISKANEGDGSGIIITPEGLVLSAAHVVDNLGDTLELFTSNGGRASGVVVSINHRSDTALCRITSPAPAGGWPHRPIRPDADLAVGDWCAIISHGGGIQLDRPAPLKVGRILKSYRDINKHLLTSDCTAVNGDSGGPLFDLEGRVAGINSTILLKEIRHNSHISSQTILSQWQDELSGKRPILTGDAITQHRKNRNLAAGITGNVVGPNERTKIAKALKKSFSALPDEAILAVVDVTTFKNNKIKIFANERTEAIIKANGLDPKEVGITIIRDTGAVEKRSKAWLAYRFGDLPAEVEKVLLPKVTRDERFRLSLPLSSDDIAALKKLDFDLHEREMEQMMRFRFSHLSETAEQLVRQTVTFTDQGPIITSDVLQGDQLAQLGINPGNQKVSKEERDIIVTNRFVERYGKEKIQGELLDLILQGFVGYNKSTAAFTTKFTPEQIEQLAQAGIQLDSELGAPIDEIAPKFGDSAEEVQAMMPRLPRPVLLHQDGQQIGLATPIAPNVVLSKSSLLMHDRLLEIEYRGKKHPATVHAHDPKSDLVLIRTKRLFSTPIWHTGPTPPLGSIFLATTKDETSLGVNSVKPRQIPARPVPAKPRADGGPANYFSQRASALSGRLSTRRTELPECISHDAILFADDCGGPLYNLAGELMGINIAHFSRTTNYALTKSSIDAAVKRLMSAPAVSSPIQTDKENTHVFFWIGGSNMVGRSPLTEEDSTPVRDAYVLRQFGTISWEPLTAEIKQERKRKFFSPMAAFARAYRKQHPNVTVCIVPMASAIALPDHFKEGGKSLPLVLSRYRFLQDEGTVKAILWQGGESSFYSDTRSQSYADDLKAAITAIRTGIDQPDAPLYYAGPNVEFGKSEDPKKSHQHPRFWANLDKIEESIPHLTILSTENLTALEDKNGTNRHFDRSSTIKLGEKFAKALDSK